MDRLNCLKAGDPLEGDSSFLTTKSSWGLAALLSEEFYQDPDKKGKNRCQLSKNKIGY